LLVAAIGCSFIPLGEVAPTLNIAATVQARLKQETAAQSTTTPVVVIWGTQGTGDGRFKNPRSVAVASDGSVYVADVGNFRIQKFTSEGIFVSKWGNVSHPFGIPVASDGSVSVADTYNRSVQRFTSEGVFISNWGTDGTGDGEFQYPSGVAVASDGSVYVTDADNHRIQKFTVRP